MATQGRNRSEIASNDIERERGVSEEIDYGSPDFEANQGNVKYDNLSGFWNIGKVGGQLGQSANTYNLETAADAVSAAAAEAKAAAEARAAAKAKAEAETAKRQSNDQKIAKEAQEAQAKQRTTSEQTSPRTINLYSTLGSVGYKIDVDSGKAIEDLVNKNKEVDPYRWQSTFEDRIKKDGNVKQFLENEYQRKQERDAYHAKQREEYAKRREEYAKEQKEKETPKSASSAVDQVTGKKYKRKENIPNQDEANARQQQRAQQVQAQQAFGATVPTGAIENTEETPSMKEFAKTLFYNRSRQARKYNKSLYRQFYQERRRNPDLTEDEFFKEHPLDQEAFDSALPSSKHGHYRSNKEYEEGRALRENGQADDVEPSMKQRGRGVKFKDTYKQDRLEDQTVWDMKVGFFPVKGEKVVLNEKTGELEGHWSLRVENAMNTVMEDFNGSGIDGQRTVFRMARLYASMAIDRQGKMFNEDVDKWELTEQEFIDICDCMHRSTLIFGHPFVAPVWLFGTRSARKTLRGTDMFPSGVIPDVVAKAITGEDSAIRFPNGHPRAGEHMTAEELQDACWEEWINRTQPVMNATLVNRTDYRKKKKQKKTKVDDGVYVVTEEEAKERNLVAQRIAIESAMRAFARLDGMGADEFGDKFNIDTAQHYKLWEYKDSLIEYASATNGKYDSEAVKKREEEKVAEYERQNRKRRGRRKVSAFEASCNLMTSGIKTNALWWNLPIRFSAIAEKGVGNAQTWLTLGLLKNRFANPERYQISSEITDAFRSEEGYKAIDAAYLLLELGGPGALSGFAKEGKPMTQENAIAYLQNNVLRQAGSEKSARIQELNIKLNKFSQRILAGNTAFKKSDITNFFNALMISNQAVADAQNKLAEMGMVDEYAGLSLTGDEMYDIFQANNGDVQRFLSEIMTTAAGKDALIMMRANNIAQFNVVGYKVNSFLRDHGIGNAMITSFLDTFTTYGVNFLYAMIPGSRTFTYLSLKQSERNGNITAADFAMGGGIGERTAGLRFTEDPGFYNGLKMNIMFDAITMGKWVCGGILIGGVLFALGFEPPDDPEDILNISMWKIGKNVGFGPDTDGDGKGNGIEIQNAYWINDLTQWGLPNAYAMAVALTLPEDVKINNKGKLEIIQGIFTDSISDQFDGNVVLDITDCILNWGDDMVDIQKTIDDPTHEMQTPSPFFGLSELGLRAFGKMVPGAPLYRAWGTSAALRGPNARMFSTNKVFDKSSDWAKQVGKTDYIEDPVERLIRKYSAGNWLLAGFMDLGNMLSPNAGEKTGYLWWEMPVRTKTEPYMLALIEEQKMDYDHLEDGETVESYNAKRTDDLRKMIAARGYESPEEAIRDGFIITHDIRYAALDTIYSEINAMENEYRAKCDEQFETYEDWAAYYYDYYKPTKSELYNFINDWLKNKDIPSWTENYEQILSDWDITYVKADGSPATSLDLYIDRIFNQGQGVEEKWKLKGNAPTSLLPFTPVQYETNEVVRRGWSGETLPSWLNEDSNLTSFANLKALGDEIIAVGRDAGSTVNDVYYGEEYDGQRLHEGKPTIGERAHVPKETKLPDDISGFNKDNASGGIYGDMGKASGDDTGSSSGDDSGSGEESSEDGDKKPWKGYGDKKPWKTSGGSSGGGFYSARSYKGSNSSYEYNPKIYSTPHQVNADRASTMYTKQPQSTRTTYLRPSFSTKGSREAYKRQDI